MEKLKTLKELLTKSKFKNIKDVMNPALHREVEQRFGEEELAKRLRAEAIKWVKEAYRRTTCPKCNSREDVIYDSEDLTYFCENCEFAWTSEDNIVNGMYTIPIRWIKHFFNIQDSELQ